MVFSAFLLGYMLCEVPGGWMGDRWGARRVLTRIVLCWSLFTALSGCMWPFTLDSGYRLEVPGVVVLLSMGGLVLLGLGLVFGSRFFASLKGITVTGLVAVLLFGLRLLSSLFGLSFLVQSLVIPLLVDSFLLLLLIRFLFGCGEAGAFPNLARVVGIWFPFRERGLAQGAIWMSARLGGAIAFVVIGTLTGLLGWRLAFVVLGTLGAVWCVFFAAWYRDRPEDKPECNEAERELIRGGPGAARSNLAYHAPLPEQPALGGVVNVLAICLAGACVSFAWYFFATWQPRFFKDVHGLNFKQSELLMGLPFLSGAAGCLLGGGLSDWLVRWTGNRRWGRSAIGVAGFGAAWLCVLAAAFVPKTWQAISLLCLATFLNDLAIPVIWAVCADIGGRYAGTVSGIMNCVSGVGAVLGPALTPVILKAVPGSWTVKWQVVFIVYAAAWFVGALAWLRIDAGTPLLEEKTAP
jgi:MFS family permease